MLTSLNTFATGTLFNEEEVIEVDQLEEKNSVKNNMPMPKSHTAPALSRLCGSFLKGVEHHILLIILDKNPSLCFFLAFPFLLLLYSVSLIWSGKDILEYYE